MEILTPFQQEVLKAVGQTALAHKFYLTGGTALSAFYLHHRYSVDLDFFTADPTAIAQVATEMRAAGRQVGAEVTFTRTLNSFLECFLRRQEGESNQGERHCCLSLPLIVTPLYRPSVETPSARPWPARPG